MTKTKIDLSWLIFSLPAGIIMLVVGHILENKYSFRAAVCNTFGGFDHKCVSVEFAYTAGVYLHFVGIVAIVVGSLRLLVGGVKIALQRASQGQQKQPEAWSANGPQLPQAASIAAQPTLQGQKPGVAPRRDQKMPSSSADEELSGSATQGHPTEDKDTSVRLGRTTDIRIGRTIENPAGEVLPSVTLIQPPVGSIDEGIHSRTPDRYGNGLLSLTRSRAVLVLAAVSAGLLAIGESLGTTGWIIIRSNSVATIRDLFIAQNWVVFGGPLTLLIAILSHLWSARSRGEPGKLWELDSLGLAVLCITIGCLIDAAGSLIDAAGPFSSSDFIGHIIFGVGVALIGITIIVTAAAHNLRDNQQKSLSLKPEVGAVHSHYWLWFGLAALLLAVSFGFPISFAHRNLDVISGSIGVLGISVLLVSLIAARGRLLMNSSSFQLITYALVILIFQQISKAIAFSLYSGRFLSLLTISITQSVTAGLGLIAFLLLGAGAWSHLNKVADDVVTFSLASGPPSAIKLKYRERKSCPPDPSSSLGDCTTSVAPGLPQDSESRPTSAVRNSPSAQQPLVHCGRALVINARFCPICGTRLDSPS